MPCRLYLCVMMSLAVVQACTRQKPVSPEELSAFIIDDANGLHKRAQVGSLTLECSYRPTDFVIAQEIESKQFHSQSIDSIKRALSSYTYFLFKVSKEGHEIVDAMVGDSPRFNQVLDHLSFKIGNDFRLINKRDTVRVEDFIYARSFGAANGSSVLLAFKYPVRERSGDVSLIFDDSFFETGLTQFDFDIADINSTPSLDLNLSSL